MGEPIRVLQIIGLSCGGGVEAVIMNYYRHIDKSKVQFDFVVHKNPLQSFADEARSMGAKVYEITPYTKNIIKFTYEIYKIIKEGNYTIVHSNMNSLGGFPLMAAYFAGARVRILHNHTTDNTKEGLRTVVKRVLRPFARLCANNFWACSRTAAKWMYGRKKVLENEVTIINNAIDLNSFSFKREKRENLRKKLDLKDKFVVGHVGRFEQTKNHKFIIEVFIEIVKQKDNAFLILIGDGTLMGCIRDKVDSLGLTSKVAFLGVRNDVADLYNVIDIFLFPSLYEGFGMVALEAQVNGLPVIASKSVPRESKFTDNMIFVDLSDGANIWADKALKASNKDRLDNVKSAVISGFDIRRESKKLEERYLKMK